ncbi:MAG: hypothetical protein IPL90_07275 [Holophagales bacterium]|nr:hypothetical protein [Holophagales bacterium]
MKGLRDLLLRFRESAGRRPFEVALLVALALLLVPYRTLLGPGVPSGRDLVPYFYPLKAHLVEALLAGEMPWIDRFRWGGLPLLSSPGAAAFDPGNVLFLLLPTAAAAKAWMLLRILSGAAGFAVFLRVTGLPPLSSALGALAWGASGITASSASFLSTSSAHAMLPWFAAALLRVRARRDRRSVAALAVATALLVVASVPEPLLVAGLLALVLLAGRGESGGVRERLGAAALWGAAGLLGALLAAPALAAYLVTGLDSIRGAPGALLPGFAEQGALPLARLPDLFADGVVADWTSVIRADGISTYPYFPSLTPGRVAWILALLALVTGRGGRLRAFAMALLGVLLALGPATPLFGLILGIVPYASSIRYPEKYAVLFGFGVVWLAALGAAVLEKALAGRGRTLAFLGLGLLLVLDRTPITSRLIPFSAASLLEERPPVLDALPVHPTPEAPPRIFPHAMYEAAGLSGTKDPRESGEWLKSWAFPFSASLFGVASVFERDYDAALPRPQLEWVLFVETSPGGSPVPAALARSAGALGTVVGGTGSGGRSVPAVRLFRDPVPPFRFVDRVVRGEDPQELAKRFLQEGVPTDAAFVRGAGEGPVPSRGRLLRVSDRPSRLELEVEVTGPGPAYLLVCRPLVTTREAAVDALATAVDDANFGFSGLAVPKGRHVVQLRPRRGWLIIAAVISALALAATSILCLRRRAAVSTE